MQKSSSSLRPERSRISRYFLSAETDHLENLPPISEFLRHLAKRTLASHLSIDNPPDRRDFVFWMLESFCPSRSPYQIPLPVELLSWLNEPAIDVSAEVLTAPALTGSVSNLRRKYLTRFMAHVWAKHSRRAEESANDDARHYDVFTEQGFYSFLAWYAIDRLPALNLPPALLPQELVDLLNRPAADFDLPLTTGMLADLRLRRPQLEISYRTRTEAIYTLSFEALGRLRDARDPRLIPSFVSRFWWHTPSRADGVTAYQYVAAKAFPEGESAPQATPADVKAWFGREYVAGNESARLMSIAPFEAPADVDRSTIRLDPSGSAIVVYRDHTTVCGLSTAGWHAKAALEAAGYHVADVDYAIPRHRVRDEYRHNARQSLNYRRRLHLINLNPEYVPECLLLHLSKLGPSDYIVGQFYWELTDISDIHELALQLVDEVWVASEYLAEVYSARTEKPVINMRQAVSPRSPALFSRSFFGLPSSDYLFLLNFDAGSSLERKNPLAAVQAFRQAFPEGNEPVGLILKTRNLEFVVGKYDRPHWDKVLEHAEQDRRIRIIDRTLTEDELAGLLHVCDCYVSLHRSEGFGYGVAEAMLQSKPVIVTDYSAVRDFCTADTSLLVPYRLSQLQLGMYPYMDPDRTYSWAAPDVDAAARHMRWISEHRLEGRELGRRGRSYLESEYSVQALALRYRSRLEQLGFTPGRSDTPADVAVQGTFPVSRAAAETA